MINLYNLIGQYFYASQVTHENRRVVPMASHLNHDGTPTGIMRVRVFGPGSPAAGTIMDVGSRFVYEIDSTHSLATVNARHGRWS